jgi:hypothetical protein
VGTWVRVTILPLERTFSTQQPVAGAAKVCLGFRAKRSVEDATKAMESP